MNTTHSGEPLNVQQIRPGIFQITTASFVAEVDAEAYVPEVFVRYATGVGRANACNPVYSRDHDFRGTGIAVTVVNANPGHVALSGEVAAAEALLDAAYAFSAEQACSCGYRRMAVAR